MKTSVLRIEGIDCWAHHGCLGEETRIGGRFTVDVILESDFQKAVESDELRFAADYVRIHDIVKEEMAIPSKLIEHAAGRILKRTAADLNNVSNITVRIAKHNPPVNGSIRQAIIELSLK